MGLVKRHLTNVQKCLTYGVDMPSLLKCTMFVWPVAPLWSMVCHLWCNVWPIISVCQNVYNLIQTTLFRNPWMCVHLAKLACVSNAWMSQAAMRWPGRSNVQENILASSVEGSEYTQQVWCESIKNLLRYNPTSC